MTTENTQIEIDELRKRFDTLRALTDGRRCEFGTTCIAPVACIVEERTPRCAHPFSRRLMCLKDASLTVEINTRENSERFETRVIPIDGSAFAANATVLSAEESDAF